MNTSYYRMSNRDEYYTPPVLVNAILPYISVDKVVWCPFDTEDSEFVIRLRERGNKVIASHIWNGQDFFDYTPDYFDIVVSNPPFTRKLDVLKRLYQLDKPFALVLGLPILNYQEIGEFFVGKDIQLLIVDKKVSFDGNNSSFNSSYFCRGILPKDLMFVHIDHCNTRQNYVASRMSKENK